MDTIIFSILYLMIGVYEVYPLYREHRLKQVIIYIGLFGLSFLMIFLISLGIKIPNPAGPIEDVIQQIIGLF